MKNASSLTATQSALRLHDHAVRTHRAALRNLEPKVTHPSFVVEFLDGKRNVKKNGCVQPAESTQTQPRWTCVLVSSNAFAPAMSSIPNRASLYASHVEATADLEQ